MSDNKCNHVVTTKWHMDIINGLAFAFILVGTTLTMDKCHGEPKIRREAVKAGAAHWTADQDGEPKFEWNTLKGPQ